MLAIAKERAAFMRLQDIMSLRVMHSKYVKGNQQ
jgi:hypothetical protein